MKCPKCGNERELYVHKGKPIHDISWCENCNDEHYKKQYSQGFYQILVYGETYQTVADMYGVSRQNIDQRFKEFIEKVRNTVAIDNKILYNRMGE